MFTPEMTGERQQRVAANSGCHATGHSQAIQADGCDNINVQYAHVVSSVAIGRNVRDSRSDVVQRRGIIAQRVPAHRRLDHRPTVFIVRQARVLHIEPLVFALALRKMPERVVLGNAPSLCTKAIFRLSRWLT